MDSLLLLALLLGRKRDSDGLNPLLLLLLLLSQQGAGASPSPLLPFLLLQELVHRERARFDQTVALLAAIDYKSDGLKTDPFNTQFAATVEALRECASKLAEQDQKLSSALPNSAT